MKQEYIESVNKLVDTIMNESLTPSSDGELLGEAIVELVRRRLGDISVDGADNYRSKGDQYNLVLDCTQSFIDGIEEYIYKKINLL